MKQFIIERTIGNSYVTIAPNVLLRYFNKVDSLIVEATCVPAYNSGDKQLMQAICSILSSLKESTAGIIKFNVVTEIHTEGEDLNVSFIRFQAITY